MTFIGILQRKKLEVLVSVLNAKLKQNLKKVATESSTVAQNFLNVMEVEIMKHLGNVAQVVNNRLVIVAAVYDLWKFPIYHIVPYEHINRILRRSVPTQATQPPVRSLQQRSRRMLQTTLH